MERLFRRYHDPERLLALALREGRLCGLLDSMVRSEEEEFLRQFYLTRVFDRSYEEFRGALTDSVPTADAAEIVKESAEILGNLKWKEQNTWNFSS